MNHIIKPLESSADHPLPTDSPFDPFRSPKTIAARELVADVVNQIQNYEQHRKPRKRARRARDQAVFEETIAAVICNLIHRHYEDPKGSVAVSLSNRVLGRQSRYRAPALNKTFPTLLENLSAPEMAFITVEKGSRHQIWGKDNIMRTEGRQTTIQAGPSLVSRIYRYGLDFSDLGRSDSEEIIILKEKNTNGKSGRKLEYADTLETIRYRIDLRCINDWLTRAEIELYDSADPPTDTSARRLRRVFNNGSFIQGGRLFGGFWMDLKKEVRRSDLTIDGEGAVELDFGQMALRLLYGQVGALLPEGDLYEVPSLGSRDGVKKIINAALYAHKPQVRMPQGVRKYFADDIKYKYALTAICKHHAPIAGYFFKGIGFDLMFLESEVLLEVLLRIKNQSKVALPLHDGVLTSRSAVPVVKKIMEDVFMEKTGVGALVRVEN